MLTHPLIFPLLHFHNRDFDAVTHCIFIYAFYSTVPLLYFHSSRTEYSDSHFIWLQRVRKRERRMLSWTIVLFLAADYMFNVIIVQKTMWNSAFRMKHNFAGTLKNYNAWVYLWLMAYDRIMVLLEFIILLYEVQVICSYFRWGIMYDVYLSFFYWCASGLYHML